MKRRFVRSLTRVSVGLAVLIVLSFGTVGTVGCSHYRCGPCHSKQCAGKCSKDCGKCRCKSKCKKGAKCPPGCTKPCCKKADETTGE